MTWNSNKVIIDWSKALPIWPLAYKKYLPTWTFLCTLTPPRRLSSYDGGEENAAHPHMMICRLRQNACI